MYDVKWSPTHPALFGAVDGNGKFDLWNLNADTEVSSLRVTVFLEYVSGTDIPTIGTICEHDGRIWKGTKQTRLG